MGDSEYSTSTGGAKKKAKPQKQFPIDPTNTELKNVEKAVDEATSKKHLEVNLDDVLEEVKKIDNVCVFKSCKTKTDLMGANCPHCAHRFCFKHSLPEIHGCGDAAKRDERKKWLHPIEKLKQEKKEEVQNKLDRKLKAMQQERKAKQSKSKKK